MQVLITGKHLEITDLMKQHIEESFSGIFADKTLKVSTIRVIIEFEKTRSNFHVSANVSMKNRDVTTQVDNHDMYKAVADGKDPQPGGKIPGQGTGSQPRTAAQS